MNECDLHCGVPFGFPNFYYDGCIKIGTQTNYEEAIRTDDELNQIDTDIENVNNTENGTTESDTRSPIISRKNLESQREPHNVNHIPLFLFCSSSLFFSFFLLP
jgi:hypothetical protein